MKRKENGAPKIKKKEGFKDLISLKGLLNETFENELFQNLQKQFKLFWFI